MHRIQSLLIRTRIPSNLTSISRRRLHWCIANHIPLPLTPATPKSMIKTKPMPNLMRRRPAQVEWRKGAEGQSIGADYDAVEGEHVLSCAVWVVEGLVLGQKDGEVGIPQKRVGEGDGEVEV